MICSHQFTRETEDFINVLVKPQFHLFDKNRASDLCRRVSGCSPYMSSSYGLFRAAQLLRRRNQQMAVCSHHLCGGSSCRPPLWELWQLLCDIGLEEIFTGDNVRRLRIISWMCFLAALICLLSMLYYVFWGILAACLFFMGLLIRVIKNTFQEAKELKEEADFTI